jgi:hypothetical protein
MRALQRQWLLLARIPRAPQKIDAATLGRKLRDAGYAAHRRTIQRDLLALSELFPLVCDERSKPYGWSWSREAGGLTVATMAPHTALLFKIAAELLHPLLPAETVTFVRAHARTADGVLAASGKPLAAWSRSLSGRTETSAEGSREIRLQLRVPRGYGTTKRTKRKA